KEINKKFNIQTYTFGKQVKLSDSFSLTENQTHLDQMFREFSQIYKQTVSPTILLSDGNQTLGSDYVFSAAKYKQPIYSVILGDSTVYSDLNIQQFNVNKSAYLKNMFPVEVILVYHGEDAVNFVFDIQNGPATIFS